MSASRFGPAVGPVPASEDGLYCLVACQSASATRDLSTPVYGFTSHADLPSSSISHSESVPPMFGWPGSLGTNALPSPSFTDNVLPVNGVVRIVRSRKAVGVVVFGRAWTVSGLPARKPPRAARNTTTWAACAFWIELKGSTYPLVVCTKAYQSIPRTAVAASPRRGCPSRSRAYLVAFPSCP